MPGQGERFDTLQRRKKRKAPKWKNAVLIVCAAVFVFSAAELIRYAADYFRSQANSRELQALYYAETQSPEPETPEPAAVEQITPAPSETPAPTIPSVTQLPVSASAAPAYANNPTLTVSDNILRLQRQNKDIVAWLSLEGLLSEAVVQRDNSYYLKRDYRGYHNDNGALFLDEVCDLAQRPMLYAVYGHNMKTGAMFGALRNYENISFLHSNPFVDFNTMYENGKYVIFSVCNVHVDTLAPGLYGYEYASDAKREEFADMLKRLSVYSATVDVKADDQLLLLITCNGDDTERRVVACRRVRDNESEEKLLNTVSYMNKK